MTLTSQEETAERTVPTEVDAVVVGGGFAGLYLLHRFHQEGRSVIAFDGADDVGGTWYWNRYPGARCDVPTTDYCFTFDPALEKEWTWSEKYATQPEILSYLQYVAEKYDLRKDIRFSTRVTSARWDQQARRWRLETDRGDRVSCRFYIMASGCLSVPKELDIEGADRFRGEVYFTSRWPHDGVDFSGKRVAVVGTGSSGIQSIPLIAAQADQLTVFQRTPNFTFPAHNGPPRAETLAALESDREGYRESARYTRAGVPLEGLDTTLLGETSTPDQCRERFDWAWDRGELFATLAIFADQALNPKSNDIAAELYRDRVRQIVKDPETAESLCPKDHYMGTKRPCLDTNYFETYNLPHVRLIDLRQHPISTVTETGIDTVDESLEFDAIVYATGFDAMTGALVSVDIAGRDGLTLKQKWADGPVTYLGLTTTGFPNFFTITGPGSPSVLCNMALAIEQHVDWVIDCINHMDANGLDTIEPTATAESGWTQHVSDCAEITLLPTAKSWYMGANVPGKPRMFYVYIGGLDAYRTACNEVASSGYLGFQLEGPAGTSCNDGIIRQMQPDVAMILKAMEKLGMPPMESMSPDQARTLMKTSAAIRPPGPQVGAVVDGVLPGPGGEIPYRLYRPEGEEPHPAITYFHGGGWVLGDLDSDDPLCRDLCSRTGAVVVSVNYRHAPEDPFPAAVEDAIAALRWIDANATEIGAIPGELAVAGWSAGGNLAAGVCQAAKALGEPEIRAQLLITPVIDGDTARGSYSENGEGYGLTAAALDWLFDHYIDPEERKDPRFAVIQGDLAGLPPAVVVTAQFDPLRDEGEAYAEALAGAGVPVRHIRARGHVHTSLTMVDMALSGARVRAEMTQALREFLPGALAAVAASPK